jgi:hypothetical protein
MFTVSQHKNCDKEHQMSARYTRPGERKTKRGAEKPQYEDRNRTDILKISKIENNADVHQQVRLT